MKASFQAFLEEIPDHRIKRKRVHSLGKIIFMAVAATLCGADSWPQVVLFSRLHIKVLSKFVDMSAGIPSKDTFRRFFAKLDPEAFGASFTKWMNQSIGNTRGEVVSIDGKRIRRASLMEPDSPMHIVSAWAGEHRAFFGQLRTDDHSNEISVIPRLLDMINVKKATVTIDAMGCQKEIAAKIVEKKADYVLSLKRNHPTLYDDVVRTFSEAASDGGEATLNMGHGRIETRRYCVCKDLKRLWGRDEWPNLRAVVKVESQRIDKKTGAMTEDTRYFITSLTDGGKIAKAIRSHWGIESCHWILDMDFGEDASLRRKDNTARNINIINKMVINNLKQEDEELKKQATSLRTLRKAAGWDDKYLEKVIRRF